MTEKKEAAALRFEKGMKQFVSIRKGLSFFKEIAVDMFLGEEYIGHIVTSGKVTISGYATASDPSKFMSYANEFTLAQWSEIGAKAHSFMHECVEREAKYKPAFEKLEELARETFSEDGPFGHSEIAKIGSEHLAIAGGKGEWSTYAPGIYTYDDQHYVGEAVKVGYRPVEEQRVNGVNNLDDDMLLELVKAADSVGTFEG